MRELPQTSTVTYHLYYALGGTVAMSVRWVLMELAACGVSVQEHEVPFDDQGRTLPEYRKISPKGRVPALIIEETTKHGTNKTLVTESTAILLLLAERHPDVTLEIPAGHPGRTLYLETMIFLANTMLPSFRDYWYGNQDTEPGHGEEDASAIKRLALRHFHLGWDLVEEQLQDEGGPYMLGDRVSVADFLVMCMTLWSHNIPLDKPFTSRPAVVDFIKQMKTRPTWKEFARREEIKA